jgi:hypothetical protein
MAVWAECVLTVGVAQDKQARLLSQEAGHFSLVRALHLADFITELNGTVVFVIILSRKKRIC